MTPTLEYAPTPTDTLAPPVRPVLAGIALLMAATAWAAFVLMPLAFEGLFSLWFLLPRMTLAAVLVVLGLMLFLRLRIAPVIGLAVALAIAWTAGFELISRGVGWMIRERTTTSYAIWIPRHAAVAAEFAAALVLALLMRHGWHTIGQRRHTLVLIAATLATHDLLFNVGVATALSVNSALSNYDAWMWGSLSAFALTALVTLLLVPTIGLWVYAVTIILQIAFVGYQAASELMRLEDLLPWTLEWFATVGFCVFAWWRLPRRTHA